MVPIALAGIFTATVLASYSPLIAAQAAAPLRPNVGAARFTSIHAIPVRTVDFEFTDIDGRTAWLSDVKGYKALVIVMRDTGCPISKSYAPRVARLEKKYGGKGVTFLYLNVNSADTPASIRREVEQFGFAGQYVHDPKARIGRLLGVRSTGEVFVLDASRRLQYRGALDDQYGIGYTRPRAKNEYLKDALDRVLAGRPVEVRESDAPGCLLGLDQQQVGYSGPVTYHNRVSRIVQANCQDCHRTGGMAPFALERYEDVHAKRAMIRFMIKSRRMPPWFAHRDVGAFANDRSMPDGDLHDLLRWIEEGTPEGDSRDAPAPRTWAAGWQIGEPDAVVKMPEAFSIPAEGVVDYQYFYVKTDFPEDRWIERMELRPGASQQVHHALVFIEEPGRKRENRQPDEPPFQAGGAGFFAAYAPGLPGNVYPAGSAKKLPKGAWIKFQMHYTANGVAATDQTELGLVFAKEPPRAEVETSLAFNTKFVIPPGAPDHEVVGERTFQTAGTLLSFFPHMHVRGKAFKMDLVYPDGTERPLLAVPRYDFNWQLIYRLKEPIHVPAGAKLRATGWFDNSTGNPYNPDPAQEVRHGEQSWDEMMIGYFDWIATPKSAAAATGSR